MNNYDHLKIPLGYLIICLIWGSTWLVIRAGLDSLTPLLSAGLRFFVAAVLFYSIIKLKKVDLPLDKNALKLYAVMGIFSFVIPFAFVYWAEQFVASGLTAVLFAIYPFVVIIFSRILIPSEEIGIFKVAGTIIGFVGIYFIFSDDLKLDFNDGLWGMLAILVSAAMQAVVAVIIKKHGHSLNPLSMNFIPVLMAGIILIPLSLLFEDTTRVIFDEKAIFSVLYLSLIGTVISFSTYYWLMKRMNVVLLSLNSLITPIIAVFLGWAILGEMLSYEDFVGTSLVIFGLFVANTRGIFKYLKLKVAR